jgi:aminoglycoside phosphotransferase (APT) family kinase protein
LFRIRSEWKDIKQKLAILPSCVAHLDFVKKNIRIDFTGSKPEVQVMDWGSSRYGLPVRDMAGLDMLAYQDAGHRMGMKLTREELNWGEQAGRLVKTVLYLHEEMSNPELLERAKSIDNLKAYEQTFSSMWSKVG